jgi:hypothetical protein
MPMQACDSKFGLNLALAASGLTAKFIA